MIRVNLWTYLRNSKDNLEFCFAKMLNFLARSSSMVINSYQSQIFTYTIIHDKATIKAACLFWAFSSLVDLSRETSHAFLSRPRIPTYLCYSYTRDTHPHMHSIYYCTMRIKVISLAILHQKRGMGYRKKWENKTAKRSSIQKKREKDREKRK
jgi:hypothetical protein